MVTNYLKGNLQSTQNSTVVPPWVQVEGSTSASSCWATFDVIFTNSLVSEEAECDAVGNEVLGWFVSWSLSHETVKRGVCIVSEET